jgi:peptidoglycan/LPS O-acetylase OafA/YrhL
MNKLNLRQSLFIDGVRGISSLGVLVGHTLSCYPNTKSFIEYFPLQSYGVVLFFILSGFLIGYQSFIKINYTFLEYLIDRFSRIFCAFVPALVFIGLIDKFFIKSMVVTHKLTTFLLNVLMLHQINFPTLMSFFKRISPFGSAAQLWTISIEWWLYVGYGCLFFIFQSSSLKKRIFLLFLSIISFAILYCASHILILIWVISALFSFLFVYQGQWDFLRRSTVFMVINIIAILLLAWRLYQLSLEVGINVYDFQLMLFTLMLFSGILLAFQGQEYNYDSYSLAHKIIQFFSKISYSLYLTHYSTLMAYQENIGIESYMDIVFFILISIFVAYLFTLLFDNQHQKLRSFLKKRLC